MFIYVMKIVIKPYKTAEFENTLRPIWSNFLKAKGCLGYSVCQDTEKKNTFMVVGEWQTRQAREKHFKTHDYEVLIGAARVLGENFAMNIAEVTESGALELARKQIPSQLGRSAAAG
jgi:quinol monooxygenase YgiN